MSQIKSVEDMCQKVSARKGQIDVIVNNAGLFLAKHSHQRYRKDDGQPRGSMGHQLPVS